jgi:hypothetical protein
MSYLNNGYQTLISFASNPTVHLKEKTVTPPGIDGGDEIDTTTMRNSVWRTKQPRTLKTLTEASITAVYDPLCYNELLAMINVNQQITITFPDGSSLQFWGWLKNFTPNENSEGEQPTAACSIVPGNQDNTGAEVGPTYAAAP